ncbi:chemotaxis protein [Marinomonas sp. SBI22]|jgi:methyl-accepting chemotaxis protein|uniref:methyl-accepting chemotaxis protein n=1 Tax=unclassified Marinomonas TaxID=196814 RepID=UPI0005FA6DE1|nr:MULTISPECIES: methyl-accepting chemotaxis protein [unclassified Marinomonas]KJZ13828.1 chemotaxis protein [Marinomonas sp. S3726]KZM44999.1 chemotaxis protein [Marinomonas sp. SBI22]KZM46698.1 chemotaxis protein [Marinomonas sp. SBI8L]
MLDLSVKTKTLSLVALFAVLIIALTINSAYSSKKVAQELNTLSTHSLELVKNLEKSRQLLLKQSVEFERGYFQVSIAKSLSGYGVEQIAGSAEAFKEFTSELELSLVEVTNILGVMPRNTELDELLVLIDTLKENQVAFLESSSTTYSWWTKLKTMQANRSRKAAKASLEAVNTDMEQIIAKIDAYVTKVNQEQNDQLEQNLITSSIVAFIAIAVGIVISLLMVGNISSALQKSVNRAKEIAAGNLTHKSSSQRSAAKRDEIGQLEIAMDTLVEQLSSILNDVSLSSHMLTEAADNLNEETKNSSKMVEEQQSETDLISQAINEIQSTAMHVSESTSDASSAAQDAALSADEGHKIVIGTISSIENLASEINTAAQTINKLEEDTNNITQILNVILGIAEQTNLLALNAAIEAARAGEQGRGFAVVADEVRTLAQNTQDATQQIEQMISKLQSGTSQAVKAMQSSHTISTNVVDVVKEEETSLESINNSVSKIRDMNNRISATAEQQASVTSEVNTNVSNIAAIAVKSTQSIHTITDDAAKVAKLAKQLCDKIEYFKM